MIDRLTTAGTETQLVALIRHLDRARVQPFLCLLDGQDELSRSLEPAACPVLRLGVRSLHHPATLLGAFRLGRFLRRQKIDVLQVYFRDSSYLGVPVARLAGVRRIVRTRNNLGYWMTPLHRWLGWLCNLGTDVVLANCDACRRAAIADERISPGRVRVLENGVDLSRFACSPRPPHPYPSPPSTGERGTSVFPSPLYSGERGRGEGGRYAPSGPRIGIVANLRPVKNLDVFVRAAAKVGNDFPQATFHIAGEGELRRGLEQLARELGLAGRLFLEGSVAEIPAFLAELDIAVLCSESEGMSNALLEYMAAGKAIVATTVGANGQLIENNVHGLLISPGDPSQLASAIRRLIQDPDLARRLGKAARRRVQACYSREAMVRRFEAFYQELLTNYPPLAAKSVRKKRGLTP
jgi:glycosyltransferase involved in cell wall biosynthesis